MLGKNQTCLSLVRKAGNQTPLVGWNSPLEDPAWLTQQGSSTAVLSQPVFQTLKSCLPSRRKSQDTLNIVYKCI